MIACSTALLAASFLFGDLFATIGGDEHPRPHFKRANWQTLNGIWEWAEAKPGESPPVGKALTQRIRVPFPVESKLSGIQRPTERMWYRRVFESPRSRLDGDQLLLHFEAVDWEATVYVNGVEVGHHRGGYDPFTIDITRQLHQTGTQELIVGVFDPADAGDQPRGKQVRNPEGIWYTPSSGIWQTVWLERVPRFRITDIRTEVGADLSSIEVTVSATPAAHKRGCSIRAFASPKLLQLNEAKGPLRTPLTLQFDEPARWTPDSPVLYELRVELRDEAKGRIVDRIESYFALRTVKVAKDEHGVNRIFLNNEPIFLVGPLDQGFWPDGLYTAPSDAALAADVELTKKLGFNCTRKHVKVEPARWYWHCDRLGLIVLQDMPSGNNATNEGKNQFKVELDAMIAARRNHPCIAMWVVFNEGWGQFATERLTAHVKELDPSRIVTNASGWTDMKCGDVIDIHSYPNPAAPPIEDERACVLGEFGGLGLPIAGHLWKAENWGYQAMADREHLTSRYETLLRATYDLNANAGLACAIYTQLTDVEIETNGLVTYDREVMKPDLARVAAANRGDFRLVPPPPQVRVLASTSESAPQEWRVTLADPGDGFAASEFDDGAWTVARGGFGAAGTPGAVIGTPWTEPAIWMRRSFDLSEPLPRSPRLRVHHDEDCEVFVNGVLALALRGYSIEYEDFALSAAARAALAPGKNVFAVRCRQTRGGQFIDVGLVDYLPAQK